MGVAGEILNKKHSEEGLKAERAYFLMSSALNEDEVGNVEESIELYSQAVELCIKTVSTDRPW